MMMPIVSMNKMAMNESVATTCCYRKVPTATVLYWEVLHGGWVGNGFVERTLTKAKYDGMASWTLSLGVDWDWIDDVVDSNVAKGSKTYEVITVGSVKRLYGPVGVDGTDPEIIESSVQSAFFNIFGDAVKATQDCDHSDMSKCKMKYLDQYYAIDQHFEATSSHTVNSGQKWNKAHDANQYSS